jgi:hypothetical protein
MGMFDFFHVAEEFLPKIKELDENNLKITNLQTKSLDCSLRDYYITKRLAIIKNYNLPLFHSNGPLKDLPTKSHVSLIMFAYSPQPNMLISTSVRNALKSFILLRETHKVEIDMVTYNNKEKFYKLTMKQLKSWRLNYHKLILGKPSYDILIDDKSLFYKKNWRFDLLKKVELNGKTKLRSY